MKKTLGVGKCFLIGLSYGVCVPLLAKLLFNSVIALLASAGIAGALSFITIEEIEERINERNNN